MSPTVYNVIWITYLVAGVLLLWVTYSFTNWRRAYWLGGIIRVIVFVLIFTPAKLYHEPGYVVPATMAMAFDQLLGHEEAAFASMVNLIVSGIVCTIIYIMYSVILQIVHSRSKK